MPVQTAAVVASDGRVRLAFPVDRLRVELKYAGRLALAEWVGGALATTVVSSFATRGGPAMPDRVVALPLAATRQRGRGFNQAREIARSVARGLALPLAEPLDRVAAPVPQTALAWRERVATFAARLLSGATFAARGSHRSTTS